MFFLNMYSLYPVFLRNSGIEMGILSCLITVICFLGFLMLLSRVLRQTIRPPYPRQPFAGGAEQTDNQQQSLPINLFRFLIVSLLLSTGCAIVAWCAITLNSLHTRELVAVAVFLGLLIVGFWFSVRENMLGGEK